MEAFMDYISTVLLTILQFQYMILPPIILSVWGFKGRKWLLLRAAAALVVYCVGSSLLHTALYPYLLFGQIDLSYLIVIFFAVLCVFFCCDVRIKNILFFVLAAYAVQNAAYNLIKIFIAVTGIEYREWVGCWVQVVGYVICYFFYYLFFIRKVRNADDINWDNKVILIISFVTLAMVYVMSSFFTSLLENKELGLVVVARSYAFLCCLLELVIQMSLCYRDKQEQENEILELLLYTEKKQHEQSKENIELINMKCHDFKHQISALRSGGALADGAFIDELESAVSIYDSTIKTGNSSLDVILTEKGLYCRNHEIKLSCIVDGDVLSFINAADLYSLFGNILSNAIESVSEEPDPQKRIIDLNIGKREGFIKIHVENYCAKKLKFEGGIPVTTKADKAYHGFGIKSIRYLTEKYGGTLSLGQRDDIFYLNILFPLKENEKG